MKYVGDSEEAELAQRLGRRVKPPYVKPEPPPHEPTDFFQSSFRNPLGMWSIADESLWRNDGLVVATSAAPHAPSSLGSSGRIGGAPKAAAAAAAGANSSKGQPHAVAVPAAWRSLVDALRATNRLRRTMRCRSLCGNWKGAEDDAEHGSRRLTGDARGGARPASHQSVASAASNALKRAPRRVKTEHLDPRVVARLGTVQRSELFRRCFAAPRVSVLFNCRVLGELEPLLCPPPADGPDAMSVSMTVAMPPTHNPASLGANPPGTISDDALDGIGHLDGGNSRAGGAAVAPHVAESAMCALWRFYHLDETPEQIDTDAAHGTCGLLGRLSSRDAARFSPQLRALAHKLWCAALIDPHGGTGSRLGLAKYVRFNTSLYEAVFGPALVGAGSHVAEGLATAAGAAVPTLGGGGGMAAPPQTAAMAASPPTSPATIEMTTTTRPPTSGGGHAGGGTGDASGSSDALPEPGGVYHTNRLSEMERGVIEASLLRAHCQAAQEAAVAEGLRRACVEWAADAGPYAIERGLSGTACDAGREGVTLGGLGSGSAHTVPLVPGLTSKGGVASGSQIGISYLRFIVLIFQLADVWAADGSELGFFAFFSHILAHLGVDELYDGHTMTLDGYELLGVAGFGQLVPAYGFDSCGTQRDTPAGGGGGGGYIQHDDDHEHARCDGTDVYGGAMPAATTSMSRGGSGGDGTRNCAPVGGRSHDGRAGGRALFDSAAFGVSMPLEPFLTGSAEEHGVNSDLTPGNLAPTKQGALSGSGERDERAVRSGESSVGAPSLDASEIGSSASAADSQPDGGADGDGTRGGGAVLDDDANSETSLQSSEVRSLRKHISEVIAADPPSLPSGGGSAPVGGGAARRSASRSRDAIGPDNSGVVGAGLPQALPVPDSVAHEPAPPVIGRTQSRVDTAPQSLSTSLALELRLGRMQGPAIGRDGFVGAPGNGALARGGGSALSVSLTNLGVASVDVRQLSDIATLQDHAKRLREVRFF